jgi:UDP-N-acetyl-D-mannosaminuronate dehydrogenase
MKSKSGGAHCPERVDVGAVASALDAFARVSPEDK